MSVLRLVLTAAAMGCAGLLLASASPGAAEAVAAFSRPQQVVDAAGADALLLPVAAAFAWLTWAWGTLGLLLTAATALPGIPGAVARLLQHLVLPAGARTAAAVALGLGIGVAAPLAASAAVPPPVAGAPAPDWPGTAPATVPDWPRPDPGGGSGGSHPSPGGEVAPQQQHVVVRGDCLWDIAAAHLRERTGQEPSAAEVAGAAGAWWAANTAVIGPDPDLLLPGQVLGPPPP